MIDDFWRELLEAATGLKSKCKKEGSRLIKKIAKNVLPEYKNWLVKKLEKWISLQNKMKHTYCQSSKKYTGTSYIGLKAINNKVKFLKTKCPKCEYDKSMFLKRIHR